MKTTWKHGWRQIAWGGLVALMAWSGSVGALPEPGLAGDDRLRMAAWGGHSDAATEFAARAYPNTAEAFNAPVVSSRTTAEASHAVLRTWSNGSADVGKEVESASSKAMTLPSAAIVLVFALFGVVFIARRKSETEYGRVG